MKPLYTEASMGPASENAGYEQAGTIKDAEELTLQWVQRPRTPVMGGGDETSLHRGRASMGPASENAGYGYSWTSAG